MNPTKTRPTAVWIALAILMVYIPLIFIVIVASQSESVLDGSDFTDLIIGIAEVAIVVISLMFAIWALATRRQWGRWFIALPLAYLIGTLAYTLSFSAMDPVDREDTMIGAVVGLTPLVLVIFLVSVGSKVKNYFGSAERSTTNIDHA